MEKFSKSKAPLKKVAGIQFGVLSSKQIEDISVTKTFYDASGQEIQAGIFDQNNIYDPITKKPIIGGLNDPRLGAVYDAETSGYFGHMNLSRPVYHYLFLNVVLDILKCVSFYTSKLLISPEDALRVSRTHKKKKRLKEIVKMSAKIKTCPLTNSDLPSYKKHQLKIEVLHKNPTLQKTTDGKYHTLSASEAFNILERISDIDAKILGFDPVHCRPESMMVKVLAVPPPHVRPNVLMSSTQKCEDDLTHKLNSILKVNNNLEKAIKSNSKPCDIESFENLLQYHVSTYYDNDIPGEPPDPQRSGKPLKTLRQRLVGKEGRVRGNLMGKRVDFSARTVITGDPNLSIDQVGVPIEIAKNLTIPDRVNEFNITHLQTLVDNGPDKHPGAKYVMFASDGKKKDLHYTRRRVELKCGDIVERHIDNDDVVLFNRQPSLHKMSIMAHRVVVQSGLTFRINLSVCAPYNADFDGDEMNLHVPQSIAARVEAEELMKVEKMIVSAQSNRPVMGIIQDALLATSLLTRRNIFIERPVVCNMVDEVSIATGRKTIFPEACLYINVNHFHTEREKGSSGSSGGSDGEEDDRPKFYRLWTGKQMFSLALQGLEGIKVNRMSMEAPENEDDMSQTDRKVCILNGQLLRGIIDKKTIGQTEGSLVHMIFLDYGPDIVKNFMNAVQRVANTWMVRNSFSIGIADTVITPETKKAVAETIARVKKNVLDLVNKNEFSAGRLERDINTELNSARDDAGKMVQSQLSYSNNFKNTVACGSKGSILNISQIMSCVGQQNIEGKRVTFDFTDRTLPHYQKATTGGAIMDVNYESSSKGFVENSYFSGLNAQEFFFHSKAGREGIIDTACKSVTGNTELMMIFKDGPDVIEIGSWIDNLLANNTRRIVKKQNSFCEGCCYCFENCSYCENACHECENPVQNDYSEILNLYPEESPLIPNISSSGSMDYSPVTRVVRHRPGDYVYKVTTQSGRIVTVIDSESLLVWSNITHDFNPIKTSLVNVGDLLPTTLNINSYNGDRNDDERIEAMLGNSFNDGLFMAICICYVDVKTMSLRCNGVVNDFLVNYLKTNDIAYSIVSESRNENENENIVTILTKSARGIIASGVITAYINNPFIGTTCSKEFISGLLSGYLYHCSYSILGNDSTCIKNMLHNQDVEIKIPKSQRYKFNLIIHYSNRIGLLPEYYESDAWIYIGLLKHKDISSRYKIEGDGDVILDPIIIIEKHRAADLGIEYVYDITVPGTYNFCLANGLNVRDTSDTGYLQRKLVKAQEDLMVYYDKTVRDSNGNIIQFLYGEDGMDGVRIESQDFSLNVLNDDKFDIRYGKENSEELAQLKEDRIFVKNITNVLAEPGKKIAEKTIHLPVNIKRIIDRIMCKFEKRKEEGEEKGEEVEKMEQKDIYTRVKEYIDDFGIAGSTKKDINAMTLFKVHLRSSLASKILYELNMTRGQLDTILEIIRETYENSKIVAGEMCGVVAAQSLSGPLTQMTLNSVDYNTVAMIDWTGPERPPCRPNEPVGKFIDALIAANPTDCQLQQDGHTIWLPLVKGTAKALSVDEDGNMMWTELEAVTKHLPVNKDGTKTLLKITTESGRQVICTKGKSLVVYENGKIVDKEGYDLKIGDLIPVINSLNPQEFRTSIDLANIMNSKECIFTNYMIEAREILLESNTKGPKNPWFHLIKDKVPYNRSDTLRVAIEKIDALEENSAKKKILFTPNMVLPCGWANGPKGETFHGIPQIIELDREFGFLLGSYLSEGCDTPFQICITNNNENFRKMVVAWTDKLGISNRLNLHKYEKYDDGVTICIHSTILRNLLVEICGRGSFDKRIPEFAFSAPDIFVKGLLDGYLCGDGSVSKYGAVTYGSRSLNIRDGITTLLSRFGITTTLSTGMIVNKKDQKDPTGELKPMYLAYCRVHDTDKFQDIITAVDYKQQGISDNSERTKKSRPDKFIKKEFNNTILDPVKSIEEVESATEHVYDLTVETTRNFSSSNGLNLKDTFHNSGVAAKNVTLGVPRIKELINVSKNIKAPSLLLYPNGGDDATLSSHLEYKSFRSFVKKSVILSYEEMMTDPIFVEYRSLQSEEIYPFSIKMYISNEMLEYTSVSLFDLVKKITSDRKIQDAYLQKLYIETNDDNEDEPYITISLMLVEDQEYKNYEIKSILKDIEIMYLNKICIQGLEGIDKIYIKEGLNATEWTDKDGFVAKNCKTIETEGTNLRGSFALDNIDHLKTISNDIVEVREVLGVEAARQTLINELKNVLSFDGSYVNYRHLALLVDVMTHRGGIMSISRHGLNRVDTNTSTLSKCSFEETVEILVEAATYAQKDMIKSVSENIILGQPIPCGTNAFEVFFDHTKYKQEEKQVYRPSSPKTLPSWWNKVVEEEEEEE